MTVTGTRNAPDVVDVVALGESMVTFLPARPGRLADVPAFHRSIGGAESNVACVLAAAGHSTRWVSAVGADGFGDHLVAEIGGDGGAVPPGRGGPAPPPRPSLPPPPPRRSCIPTWASASGSRHSAACSGKKSASCCCPTCTSASRGISARPASRCPQP